MLIPNRVGAARFRLTVFIVVGLLIHPSTLFSAEPNEVIETFHAALILVMKDAGNTSRYSRYKILEPEIEKAFNLPFMIRITAGSRWKRENAKGKKDLTIAFKRMSVATYVSRFEGYTGQKFQTLKVRNGPRSTRLVDTLLISPGDNPVKLTYVMHQFGHDWRIVDVLLDDGISEIAMRVSEYRATLRSKGADALAKALNKKASKLMKN